MTGGPHDEFLSDEDLDLVNLTEEELIAWWNQWLRLAQASNDLDAPFYEHGVFRRDPAVPLPADAPSHDGLQVTPPPAA